MPTRVFWGIFCGNNQRHGTAGKRMVRWAKISCSKDLGTRSCLTLLPRSNDKNLNLRQRNRATEEVTKRSLIPSRRKSSPTALGLVVTSHSDAISDPMNYSLLAARGGTGGGTKSLDSISNGTLMGSGDVLMLVALG